MQIFTWQNFHALVKYESEQVLCILNFMIPFIQHACNVLFFCVEGACIFTCLMAVDEIVADNGPCGYGRWLLQGFRFCRSAINLSSKLTS